MEYLYKNYSRIGVTNPNDLLNFLQTEAEGTGHPDICTGLSWQWRDRFWRFGLIQSGKDPLDALEF